eukprot:scaffold57539_cov18-Tisochrysis_lutea.AAC.2
MGFVTCERMLGQRVQGSQDLTLHILHERTPSQEWTMVDCKDARGLRLMHTRTGQEQNGSSTPAAHQQHTRTGQKTEWL